MPDSTSNTLPPEINKAIAAIREITRPEARIRGAEHAYHVMASSFYDTIAESLAQVHAQRTSAPSLEGVPTDPVDTVRQWASGMAELSGRFLFRMANALDPEAKRSYVQRYELVTLMLGSLHPLTNGRIEDPDDLDIFFPTLLETAALQLEFYYSALVADPALVNAARVRGLTTGRRSALRGMLREMVLHMTDGDLDGEGDLPQRINIAVDSTMASASRPDLDRLSRQVLECWMKAHTFLHAALATEAANTPWQDPRRLHAQRFAGELIWGNVAVQRVLGTVLD